MWIGRSLVSTNETFCREILHSRKSSVLSLMEGLTASARPTIVTRYEAKLSMLLSTTQVRASRMKPQRLIILKVCKGRWSSSGGKLSDWGSASVKKSASKTRKLSSTKSVKTSSKRSIPPSATSTGESYSNISAIMSLSERYSRRLIREGLLQTSSWCQRVTSFTRRSKSTLTWLKYKSLKWHQSWDCCLSRRVIAPPMYAAKYTVSNKSTKRFLRSKLTYSVSSKSKAHGIKSKTRHFKRSGQPPFALRQGRDSGLKIPRRSMKLSET